jgi:hypothetical protein
MNILAQTDRRRPHWHDQAETNALHFHPEAIADDPLHERARLAAHRFATQQPMDLDDWTALLTEAAANANPVCVIPDF